MKKIKLFLIGALVAGAVQAQQGSWYIGGTAGVGGSNSDQTGKDDATMRWNFAPEFGTFLTNQIQLGMALNINGTSSTYDGDDTGKSMGFSPVVYGRRFWKIGDNLSTYVGLNLNLITGSMTDYDYSDPTNVVESETKQMGFGANLNIGAAYALNDRFTVLAQYGLLGFSSVKNEMDENSGGGEYTDMDWGFDMNTLGPVFNVGLYYTFIPASE